MNRRRTDQPRTRRRHGNLLGPIRLLLIGGWIAATLTLWTALANHRTVLAPEGAPPAEAAWTQGLHSELDRSLQLRVHIAELSLAVALVLIAIWEREHGFRLFLPFALLTLTIALSVYVHPDLSIREGGRLAPLPLGTVALEFLKVTGLFLLFLLLLDRGRRT